MTNPENRFFSSLADITGSEAPVKTAAAASAEPAQSGLMKIASQGLSPLLTNENVVAGFQERLAERMPEIDRAAHAFLVSQS